jgi:Ca2+-binding RTX toxin-like protein
MMKLRTNEPQDLLEPLEPLEPLPPPTPSGRLIFGTNGNDVLDGSSGADTIYGSGGHDTLRGGGASDRLYGDSGNDWLEGGAGGDWLDGGAGENDTVSYQSSSSRVMVDLSIGRGNLGDAEGDLLFGIEQVYGSHFNDVLIGNAGHNVLSGGNGHDTLYGRAGHDHLYGGEGIDLLEGGVGADTMDGGGGEDWVTYVASAAGVTANLTTGFGAGGEAAGDSYYNIENIEGSAFADVLIGNAGNNKLFGNGGDDQLTGGAGNDQLLGGEGHDVLRGGSGADVLDGGAGLDTVYYQDSSAGVTVYLGAGPAIGRDSEGIGGDAEGDTYFGIEHALGSGHADDIYGTAGNNDLTGLAGDDRLWGGDGADRLLGGEGDDWLTGGAGADRLDGGNGNDWVYLSDSGAGVTVNLATGVGSGGHAQGDTYVGIENVGGSAFDDVMVGNAGNNILRGGAGNDTIIGGAGQDLLLAGNGRDILTGDGNGIVAADTFSISWTHNPQPSSAFITDFQQGVDKIKFTSGHGPHNSMKLQDFGSDGVLAWGFTDQDGLHANGLDAGDKYFFDTSTDTLYMCDFSNGTLTLGKAVVTINSDVARLQTSDFLLA